MLNPRDTCSTTEAARRLGVALSTVQAWVETGALEAWKTPGGHRRVLVKSVDRLLEQGSGQGAAKAKPSRNAAPDSSLRVLVVEDEAMMREIYAGFFRQWHLPVTPSFCENGYEALLRIGHEIPDLIMTDLSMPEMDGFQMIRALRDFEATARIPVIAVSGLSDGEIAEQGGLPGDILLLHKPVSTEQLRDVFSNALSLHPPT